jgi:hypothetical protein
MKPKVSKDLLKIWTEMTSNNDHRLVRKDIAEWLRENLDKSFDFYVHMFNVMEWCVGQQTKSNTPLPNGFLRSECALTDIMLREVYDVYKCKRLVNQINKCL